MAHERFVFGPFEVSTYRRDLRRNGRPVELSSRAFDLLVALLRRCGLVVSKAELLCEVWPGITVEPNNLEVYVSALRKVFENSELSPGPIVTVRGRGYCFVAPVRLMEDAGDQQPNVETTIDCEPPPRHVLKFNRPLTAFIGRPSERVLVRDALAEHRFVSLIGPGGVGKTRLAQEIALGLVEQMRNGAVFVDFTNATTLRTVLDRLAAELGIVSANATDANACATAIGSSHLLLIFDTCDHVFDTVALLAAYLMDHCPHLLILTTSRRRLGMPGEVIFDIAPFPVPQSTDGITATDALESEAVKLFADIAMNTVRDFVLTDGNAADVVATCQKLDGLPLAIELAVPLLKVLNPRALTQTVSVRPKVLTNPSRAAQDRHKTLRALIEWSFSSLTGREQVLFRRFAIFSGPVSLSVLRQVLFDADEDHDDALITVLELVEKSLLIADSDRTETHFRMLNVTRDHGRSKLVEYGDVEVYRRHADYVLKRLRDAETAWHRTNLRDWVAEIDDVRGELLVALTWAFGSGGDPSVGVDLVGLSHPVWSPNEMHDYRIWIEKAFKAAGSASAEAVARLKCWGVTGSPGRPLEGIDDLLGAAAYYRELDNAFGEGICLVRAGCALAESNDPASERVLQDARTRLVGFGATRMLATCLAGLADAKSRVGDHAAASDLERQSTAILIAIGDALPAEAVTLQRLIMASANRR